jgi:hypothetical protein
MPFIGLDTQQQPLPPVWSCRHLAAGEREGGGYYARCRLGDAEGRQRWLDKLTGTRVELMRELRRDFAEFSRPYLQAMAAAKGRQLKQRDPVLSGALRRVSDEFMRAADAYLEERSADFEEAGVPPDAARQLLQLAMEHWVESASTGNGFEVPEAVLQRLPETARLLIKPEPI